MNPNAPISIAKSWTVHPLSFKLVFNLYISLLFGDLRLLYSFLMVQCFPTKLTVFSKLSRLQYLVLIEYPLGFPVGWFYYGGYKNLHANQLGSQCGG